MHSTTLTSANTLRQFL